MPKPRIPRNDRRTGIRPQPDRVFAVRLDGTNESLEARAWVAPGTPRTAASRVFVLIHGVGLTHRSYGRLARRLVTSGTVIAVDLPGFGGLRHPKASLSVTAHAEDVKQIVTAMAVESYEVVGHSMGAQIALELAIVDRERARKVVLSGPIVNPNGTRC